LVVIDPLSFELLHLPLQPLLSLQSVPSTFRYEEKVVFSKLSGCRFCQEGFMSACAKWLGVVFLLAAGSALAEEKIVWQTDIAKALKQAKDEKKLVLVHFYGDACGPCKVVEEKVFPDPRVVRAMMRNYVPVKINVDKEDKIAAHYAVRQMPLDIFLSGGKGQEVYRMVTKDSALDYATMLDQYAIQTGIGSGRQAALQEREARYIPDNFQGGQQPPAQQQYVQNQYAPQNEAGVNRYSQNVAGPQSHVAGMPGEAVQTVYGGADAGSAQAQVGPYGSQAPAPVVQPEMVQGYGPQGGQRTSFQDPGDITGRQPIYNNFIPLKDIPPIGLDGYCPVSVAPPGPKQEGAWKKGDPRFGAVHRGRTYLFHSAAEQTKFLADPDAYSPMLSGADPVIFAETGKLVEGRRSFGMAFPQNGRNTMFFFATKENLERFEKNPQQFAVIAHQAMLKGETERKYR
jgi:YHS domain-containing protein